MPRQNPSRHGVAGLAAAAMCVVALTAVLRAEDVTWTDGTEEQVDPALVVGVRAKIDF